jgi:hypothetical protein
MFVNPIEEIRVGSEKVDSPACWCDDGFAA